MHILSLIIRIFPHDLVTTFSCLFFFLLLSLLLSAYILLLSFMTEPCTYYLQKNGLMSPCGYVTIPMGYLIHKSQDQFQYQRTFNLREPPPSNPTEYQHTTPAATPTSQAPNSPLFKQIRNRQTITSGLSPFPSPSTNPTHPISVPGIHSAENDPSLQCASRIKSTGSYAICEPQVGILPAAWFGVQVRGWGRWGEDVLSFNLTVNNQPISIYLTITLLPSRVGR
jgi:hypothetical protein